MSALEGTPKSLEQIYTDILVRIPPQDRFVARKTLFWLTFALRALRFDELCEAVVIEEGKLSIADDMRLIEPGELLKICQSLISYDATTSVVTLAHSSVREFLTSREIQQGPAAFFSLHSTTLEDKILRKCLTYLNFSHFNSGPGHINTSLQRIQKYPLLN
jgi:hypothetical protein